MAKKPAKKSSYKMLFLSLFIVLFSLLSGIVASNLAGFYNHMHQFNFHVKNRDGQEAQRELNNMKAYYNRFSEWRLRYLADRYLLPDMHLYEAETLILNDDCEKAIALLENYQEDYRAINLANICKFKVLYSAYHSESVQKNSSQKDNILKMVLDQVKPGFRMCVEKGPGPEENFNCSYNYDLVSDPDSAKKALESAIPGPEFVLGRSTEEGDKPGRGGGSGERRVEPGPAGQGQPRKGG